jgi:hypothetical protein
VGSDAIFSETFSTGVHYLCVHPAQQQGRRIPPRILDSALSMRTALVSCFLLEVTQHIHSLRASGVMSSHTAFTVGSAVMALRKSAGSVWGIGVLTSVVYSIYWEYIWDFPTTLSQDKGHYVRRRVNAFFTAAKSCASSSPIFECSRL